MEQSTGNCNEIRQLSKDKPIFLTLFRGSESVQEVVTIGSHAHGQTPIEITMVVFLLLTLDVKLGRTPYPQSTGYYQEQSVWGEVGEKETQTVQKGRTSFRQTL